MLHIANIRFHNILVELTMSWPLNDVPPDTGVVVVVVVVVIVVVGVVSSLEPGAVKVLQIVLGEDSDGMGSASRR